MLCLINISPTLTLSNRMELWFLLHKQKHIQMFWKIPCSAARWSAFEPTDQKYTDNMKWGWVDSSYEEKFIQFFTQFVVKSAFEPTNIVCCIDVNTILNQELCEWIQQIGNNIVPTKWICNSKLTHNAWFPFQCRKVQRCSSIIITVRPILRTRLFHMLNKSKHWVELNHSRVSSIFHKQMSNLFISLFCGPHQRRNSFIVHNINTVILNQIMNFFNIPYKTK